MIEGLFGFEIFNVGVFLAMGRGILASVLGSELDLSTSTQGIQTI